MTFYVTIVSFLLINCTTSEIKYQIINIKVVQDSAAAHHSVSVIQDETKTYSTYQDAASVLRSVNNSLGNSAAASPT